MKGIARALSLAFLLASSAATYAGTETLTYASGDLTGFQESYPPPDGSISNFSTTFGLSLTLNQPLVANLDNAPVVPNSWFASCGEECYGAFSGLEPPPTTPGAVTANFLFTTNGVGQIVGWNFDVLSTCCAPSANEATVHLTGSSFLSQDTFTYNMSGAYVPTVEQQALGPDGQWSESVNAAPEFDASSTGAAITLLLGGLAALRSRKVGARLG